jgi:hypothetical protein
MYDFQKHLSTVLQAGELAAHLRDEHGITDVPKTKPAQARLHAAQDHRPPAQDARTQADAGVLAGVTRKPEDTAAANLPKPKPARRKVIVEDVPVETDRRKRAAQVTAENKTSTRSKPASKAATDKPATASKPRTRQPVTPPTTVVFYLLDDFQVHKPGCRVIAREIKKSDYAEAVPLTETTEEAVIRFLWDDQIREAYEGDGEPSAAWLNEHSFVTTVHFHSCTDGILVPFTAQANGHSPREHNQELARKVLAVLTKEFADDPTGEDWQKVANWLHALPTGGAGWQRFWPEGFARPTSAGWRKPE